MLCRVIMAGLVLMVALALLVFPGTLDVKENLASVVLDPKETVGFPDHLVAPECLEHLVRKENLAGPLLSPSRETRASLDCQGHQACQGLMDRKDFQDPMVSSYKPHIIYSLPQNLCSY